MLADALRLFNQSEAHRDYTVADLQTYLLLPAEYETIRVYYSGESPVGLVTWCWMTPENSQKFLDGKYHPSPQDHDHALSEGKELWGMEFIAPYGHTRQVMREIKKVCLEKYGESDVHWRRFYSKDQKRKRKFKQ
jgi:hemolysin-activating ACP:hemolysin acyltransferase